MLDDKLQKHIAEFGKYLYCLENIKKYKMLFDRFIDNLYKTRKKCDKGLNLNFENGA